MHCSLYSNNNIESCHVNDVKINQSSLQSDWVSQCYDVTDAVLLLTKNCVRMFYCFNFIDYITFLVKVLIETNLNISNKLNFSDVYRSVNYIRSLANLT